jgi:CheY-like chemotaxis protein
MVFEDAEWEVLEAKDGPEALATLRACHSRLVVLLDWKMPEMSGEEVLCAVKADPALMARHTYVLISGNAANLSPHLSAVLHELSVPVLSKPFRIDELLRLVEAQAGVMRPEEAAQQSLSSP